jgi:hypothetical protein
VIGGPFARWQTLEGRPNIRRARGSGTLFTEEQLNTIYGSNNIVNMLCYTSPRMVNQKLKMFLTKNVHIFLGLSLSC